MTSILKRTIYILSFFTFLPACYAQQSNMKQKDSLEFSNKIVPDIIWRETYVALSHYPELKDKLSLAILLIISVLLSLFIGFT